MNIFKNVTENLKEIKKIYTTEKNSDIKIREFTAGGKKAFIVFVENIVDSETVNKSILAPLMLLKNDDISYKKIKNTLLVLNQLSEETSLENTVNCINSGDCALFVEGVDKAFICDVKNWERRSISSPITEEVIMGPHEAFVENYKTNIALVRKNLRRENMICENLSVGRVSKTPVAVMYLKGICNVKTVEETKRRIENLAVDYLYQAGELEQLIEDSPFSFMPQMLTTERPDKTAEAMVEGKIAVIVQGSPFALILPVTLSEFFVTVEDKYIRFPFAFFIKSIRLIGIVLSFLLPGLYVAILNFHQEMLPTELLFAIEASRETVPFSALVELIIMEISFDIIREASIRVPSPIGSTLGIIGALIIGDAAVKANIVSPIAIIIVAITGIGSFATPNYSLNMSFRYLRYYFIILGGALGFFGIGAGIFVCCALITTTKSLSNPMFASISGYGINRYFSALFPIPIFKREVRHNYLKPERKFVQNKISRGWENDKR